MNHFLTVTIKKKGDQIVADEGTFELTPTTEQAEKLKNYVGKEVYFGVRPEDLTYCEAPVAVNNMQMKISNKEPLGAETHLFLATRGQNIIARVQASTKESFKLGETVNFEPAMARCKFFVKSPENPDEEVNICEDIQAPWLKNLITGEVGYDKVTINTAIDDPEESAKAAKAAKKAAKAEAKAKAKAEKEAAKAAKAEAAESESK